ncbi:MAG TPA: hypothetical protein VL361_03030 [Candidatus Limnocylindrales bacterium]|jgi:hypothetical protein|nr:hypothetical protein [Candidatus Limnocylindrales bacterium]
MKKRCHRLSGGCELAGGRRELFQPLACGALNDLQMFVFGEAIGQIHTRERLARLAEILSQVSRMSLLTLRESKFILLEWSN